MPNEQEVRIYADPDRKEPFIEWERGLRERGLRDRQARARVRARIARLRLGNFGDAKRVGDGVFELRVHAGPGYRVYFGREGGVVVILLCGGDKSTQDRDIERAEDYWRESRSREHAGG